MDLEMSNKLLMSNYLKDSTHYFMKSRNKDIWII